MYPATIFNWYDNSAITIPEVATEIDDAPLFMQVFSADKGTEDLIEISGSDFDAMYGTMYFDKHGQSAIQAKNIINAGGRLYAKRVVAENSTLANVVATAKITRYDFEVVEDDNNNLLPKKITEDDVDYYVTTDGENVPVSTIKSYILKGTDIETAEIYAIVVKWSVAPLDNSVKTFDEALAAVPVAANDEFPLILYTDNGRGESTKSVKLNPDYSTSKTIGKTFYTLVVYDNSSIVEQTTVSFDPTVVYADTAYRLDKYTNIQISGQVIETAYEAYTQSLAAALGVDEEIIKSYDTIYGYTNRGIKIEGFNIDPESVDLDANTGVALENGDNGDFGYTPAVCPATDVAETDPQAIAYKAWTEAICKVFNGEFSDEVWDVDQHKIAVVVDANYPKEVKEAIFGFVSFRKDCSFFRDYGVGNNAIADLDNFLGIKAAHDWFSTSYTIGDTTWEEERNFFVEDYATTYQIKDPVTKKNIEVTMLYDMAANLVSHIANVPFAPPAGSANNMILANAIKGTINFSPVVTPKVNQKEAMDELRVNYAIFEDDNCVVQSCYTSQMPYTQLSYIGNVLGIQRVLRAVRTACPKQRYSLSTASDLQDYATAVNAVLSNYVTNFDTLEFTYAADPLKTSQKIFYASIAFAFLGWAQTEIFDIYAINND